MKQSYIRQSLITSAIMLVIIACASCTTTIQPDGTETKRLDQEAVNPWLEIAKIYFLEPSPPIEPIIVEDTK